MVSEEKSFEIVEGRRTTDGWTTEPAYTISSPGAFGSGGLKTTIFFFGWRVGGGGGGEGGGVE